MKILSISFIAAVVAAVASTTTAAPVPLHARTLEQVNSFQRDIDSGSPNRDVDPQIYPRNGDIFTQTIADLKAAAEKNHNASELSRSVVLHLPDNYDKGYWEHWVTVHKDISAKLTAWAVILRNPQVMAVLRTPQGMAVLRNPLALMLLRTPQAIALRHNPQVMALLRTPQGMALLSNPEAMRLLRTPQAIALLRLCNPQALVSLIHEEAKKGIKKSFEAKGVLRVLRQNQSRS